MDQIKDWKKNDKYYVTLKYDGKYENDEEKIDAIEMKKTIENSLQRFCNDQLICETYDILLGRPYYDIKKIILYVDMTYKDRIRNIFMSISGTNVAFKKKSSNIYTFEPIEPLPCRYCVKTSYTVIIKMNETKDMFMNKIIFSIDFMNNNDQNIDMKKMVESKIIYEINDGFAKFVQI